MKDAIMIYRPLNFICADCMAGLSKLIARLFCTGSWLILFLTWLLTSEDEYKWYWHQMIYFPETINTISTTVTPLPTYSLVSSWAKHINLLCACWHHETMRGRHPCPPVVFSRRLLTSSLFPCPGSTDAPCSRLGDPAPPFPIWLPHSQGPRTLPYRDLEHILPTQGINYYLKYINDNLQP